VNNVKFVPVILDKFDRVCLHKEVRVIGLVVEVYTDDVKPSQPVTVAGATGPAVKIQKDGAGHPPISVCTEI